MSSSVSKNDAQSLRQLEPGVIIAQKYRLERVLKNGGMGSVWIATHLGLETTVAIKFMSSWATDAPPDDDEDRERAHAVALMRVRFEREAKAAARLRSTNVVQILDHGIDRGMPYIVMEYLRGEDLEVRLRRVNRLSLGEVVPIVNALGRALQLAHAENLIHRDLKPANIFLAKEGDEEIPKILDFGIVKTLKGTRESLLPPASGLNQQVNGTTVEGTIVGTPHYMSPEQIELSGPLDHRSDLWSLGILIFRALTGRLPFTSARLVVLVVQISRDPIPRATTLTADLPPAIDVFFDKALARDPDKRFQSAREMVNAFQEAAMQRTAPPSSVSTVSLSTNVVPNEKPKINYRALTFGAFLGCILIAGAALVFRFGAPSSNAAVDPASSAQASTAIDAPSATETIAAPPPPLASSANSPSPSAASTTNVKTPTNPPRPSATPMGTSKTKRRNVGY